MDNQKGYPRKIKDVGVIFEDLEGGGSYAVIRNVGMDYLITIINKKDGNNVSRLIEIKEKTFKNLISFGRGKSKKGVRIANNQVILEFDGLSAKISRQEVIKLL